MKFVCYYIEKVAEQKKNFPKLLFYRNVSRCENVILKILMCLTGVLSDYVFSCSQLWC